MTPTWTTNGKHKVPRKSELILPGGILTEVVTHLLRNFAGRDGPRILALVGPPGVGKTRAVELIARATRCELERLLAGDCDSVDPGAPARELDRLLTEADEAVRSGNPKHKPVVLVDDVHLLFGPRTSLTQTTVNTQLLVATLMAACDQRGPRTPVVFTANTLSNLEAPLLRPMRMAVIRYEVSPQDLQKQVSQLLPELHPREVEVLVRVPFAPTIAFFADLRRAATDRQLADWVRGRDLKTVLDDAFDQTLPAPVLPPFRDLLALAKRRAAVPRVNAPDTAEDAK